jgi:hypothetical protein
VSSNARSNLPKLRLGIDPVRKQHAKTLQNSSKPIDFDEFRSLWPRRTRVDNPPPPPGYSQNPENKRTGRKAAPKTLIPETLESKSREQGSYGNDVRFRKIKAAGSWGTGGLITSSWSHSGDENSVTLERFRSDGGIRELGMRLSRGCRWQSS